MAAAEGPPLSFQRRALDGSGRLRLASGMSVDHDTAIEDLQLALDAMRDGVALWSPEGRLLVCNRAAGDLMRAPPGLIRPGVLRADVMTFFAERGDYGPTDDPAGRARVLSDRFGLGSVTSLPRIIPDGRVIQADAQLLPDGRSLVTYRELK